MTEPADVAEVSVRTWGQWLAAFVWGRGKMLVTLLAILTLLTLFARYHWTLDLLANLRVQQVILGLFLLVLCAAYQKWIWLAAVCVCLGIHLPWFGMWGSSAATLSNVRPLTVTVSNVLYSNPNNDAIVDDVLRNAPDVFVILELNEAQAAAIEARTAEEYPHRILRSEHFGAFGIGLYSKHPIDASRVFQLNKGPDSIEAVVTVRDQAFRIIGTHPRPPLRGGFGPRNEHLRMLAERVRDRSEDPQSPPTIVVGDLNVTPWSPFFADFVAVSGLKRAHVGFDVQPTWYVLPTFPLGLMLDHALISDELECLEKRVGGAAGSDHRSVTVTVTPRE